jgi:hypothetical protein|tara:strand:- start:94 stop:543 length:450 start_codon:yes stop_codon:yes gene_type:complete
MGYRSDVSILIYGDTNDVVAFVAGERLKGHKGIDHHPLDEPLTDSHERNKYEYNNQTVLEFIWWDIKWYDTYPEIAYWSMLESVWEDAFSNTSLCMEVARVGENTDDILMDYYGNNPEFYLNVSRAITTDLPSKAKKVPEVLNKESNDG